MAGTLVKLDGKGVNFGKAVKVGMTLVTGKPGMLAFKPGIFWLTAIFLLTGKPVMPCTPFGVLEVTTPVVRAVETFFAAAAGIGSTLLAKGPKPSLIPRAGLGRLSKRPTGIATGIATGLACNFLSCEFAES